MFNVVRTFCTLHVSIICQIITTAPEKSYLRHFIVDDSETNTTGIGENTLKLKSISGRKSYKCLCNCQSHWTLSMWAGSRLKLQLTFISYMKYHIMFHLS